MKPNIENRLQRLEAQLRQGDGVAAVEKVEGGYQLPGGEVVATLDELNRRYSVVIVDDVQYSRTQQKADCGVHQASA